MNPETIVDQGKFLLYRALNTRRMIGFLGSGVSAAYGRVTWTELALFHIEKLRHISAMGAGDSRESLIGQLVAMYTSKCDNGNSVLLAMQLCEQIWCLTPIKSENGTEELRELCGKFELESAYGEMFETHLHQPKLGRALFRHWVKRETHDELPHVRRILGGTPVETCSGGKEDFLGQLANRFRGKRTSDLLEKIVDDLTSYRPLLRSSAENPKRSYAALFSQKTLGRIDAIVSGLADKFGYGKDSMQNALFEGATALLKIAAHRSDPASPIRYYGAGYALELLRLCLARHDPCGATKIMETILRAGARGIDPKKAERCARSDVIAQGCDPLHRLVYDLQIKRFATTNYDLEIERFFFDIGFRPADPIVEDKSQSVESVGVGSLGGRTRDIVLTENTTVDLLDFATDDTRYIVEAVHLHGRATEDSDIVITERDYQQTYLRDDANQHAFRQGLDITFGGNPILFIALGMSEGDVLRPLREFVSTPSRRNRAIIGFRDSIAEKVKRDAFTMEQFARYGAHIIHFGFLTDAGGHGIKKRTGFDESWLCNLAKQIDAFRDELKELAESKDVKNVRRILGGLDNRTRFIKAVYDSDDVEALGMLYSDGAPIDLRFEVQTLTALQHLVKGVLEAEIERSGADGKIEFAFANRLLDDEALPKVLERIKASALTLALNAKLEGVRKGWLTWWHEWQSTPGDRSQFMSYADLSKIFQSDSKPNAEIGLWGRHIASIHDEAKLPRPPSWEYPTWLPPTRDDRRCMILTAPKGYGKGYLFGCLAKTLKISEERGDQKKYLGQFFHSFSFATEIASVWDALSVFLAAPRAFPRLYDEKDFESLVGIEPELFKRMSRLERLEWGLRRLSANKKNQVRNRALVAFNAADILFDENGQPKHSEIAAIFDMLFDHTHAEAPLDIILGVRDTRFPAHFRASLPKAGKATDGENAKQTPSSRPLNLLFPARSWAASPKLLLPAQNVISSIRRSHANIALSKDVPLTAITLTEGIGTQTDQDEQSAKDFLYILPEPMPEDFIAYPEAPHEQSEELRAQGEKREKKADEPTKLIAEAIARAVNTEEQGPEDASTPLKIVATFLKRQLASNSYGFALLRAIAEDILKPEHAGSREEAVATLRKVTDPMMLDMESSRSTSPSDHFFELVLDYWYLHDVKRVQYGAIPPELKEALLRHIAIIASPVEVEVLAECPAICEQAKAALGREGDAAERRAQIEKALEGLFERHLVFRIEPHSHKIATEPGAAQKFRYQVHRSIQTHVYRKLGSQTSEPTEGYVFAPSLYVARTRLLPRLHATSYQFLYELVDGLISYPPRTANRLLATGEERLPQIHAMCLRAALGVVRTLFSLGVVTRFADADTLPVPQPPQLGYLEHHRLAIRWMLKLACWLESSDGDAADKLLAPSDAAPKPPFKPRRDTEWPPFYRDEIVWLYNECGVFSLAQGQCYDARALFEQALKLQATIDGVDPSPMQHRVLFNAGLCAIDRGGLSYARRAFAEIRDAENAEPLMRLLATGFGAHIDHIGGRVTLAIEGFQQAIEGLEELRHLRPLAMLYSHRADLHRQRGDVDAAMRDFNAAAEHAFAGGYADLIHYAKIGAVRTRVAPQRKASEIQDVMRQLQAAEDYADRMDLPRLKCEVMFIRGEVQVNQGEMTLAGQLVTRAVRIANLNGLVLRRLAGLQLLAEIHRARGDARGADRLVARITQAARDIGYHLLFESPLNY